MEFCLHVHTSVSIFIVLPVSFRKLLLFTPQEEAMQRHWLPERPGLLPRFAYKRVLGYKISNEILKDFYFSFPGWSSWFSKQSTAIKALIIGSAVVVVLGIIGCFICCCCCKRDENRVAAVAPQPAGQVIMQTMPQTLPQVA